MPQQIHKISFPFQLIQFLNCKIIPMRHQVSMTEERADIHLLSYLCPPGCLPPKSVAVTLLFYIAARIQPDLKTWNITSHNVFTRFFHQESLFIVHRCILRQKNMLQYGEQVLRMVSGSNGMSGCMSVVMMLFIRASQKNTSPYFESNIFWTKTDYAHLTGNFLFLLKKNVLQIFFGRRC